MRPLVQSRHAHEGVMQNMERKENRKGGKGKELRE
jgi:hypothetical protein